MWQVEAVRGKVLVRTLELVDAEVVPGSAVDSDTTVAMAVAAFPLLRSVPPNHKSKH